MKTSTILAVALGSILLSSVSQAEISFKDAQGETIGKLLSVVGSTQNAARDVLQIQTPDGYLMNIDASSGTFAELYPKEPPAVYFRSEDCSGQAYLYLNQGIGGWMYRGGQIVQLKETIGAGTDSDLFVSVKWTPLSEAFTSLSYLKVGQACVSAVASSSDYIPVTVIDPVLFGIKVLNGGRYGFPLPFTQEAVKPEGLFCNGFESCPAE